MKEICEQHQIPLEECLDVNDFTCKCGDTVKNTATRKRKQNEQD